jgi:hypothetical protein
VAVLTGLYGVARDTAVSYAALVHGAVYIGSCASGIVFLVLDQKRIILNSQSGITRQPADAQNSLETLYAQDSDSSSLL